ncbi:MAG: tetratricopeptide repeat protein [Magnetococcales bacterium]|nr:tetratricopeptide repeat protein [Magnetococcales bacterium]
MGAALAGLGRFAEAIESYQKALSINPRHHETLNNLSSAQKKLGRLTEALASFQQALAIKPNYPKVHYSSSISKLDTLP